MDESSYCHLLVGWEIAKMRRIRQVHHTVGDTHNTEATNAGDEVNNGSRG